ncbi:MAG: thiamine-phosphate kinase, partial [Nanoarchaeota archaeon]
IGEFGLIDRIKQKPKDKNILVGIGDDAAVVKIGNKLCTITTDTLVEGDHFSLDYFTPEQIGMKAIEINVSDVGSMGGQPKYALVSLALKKEMDVEFVEKLYKGMRDAASKYGVEIIGGNLTHADQIMIDIDLIGFVKKENLCLRSHAKPGDFILVSGDLGGSTAGLNLFRDKVIGHESVKKKHLEPKAKLGKVKQFLRCINAMMDISDGLASEIAHICEQSKVGAVIYADNIPIKDEVREAAEAVGKNPLDYALYGGEDFELVFTVSEKNLKKVKGFLVGEITKEKGVKIYQNGKFSRLEKHGYDHFK